MKKGMHRFNISYKCPRCYREVPDGNRFCIYCGQEIAAAVQAAGQKTAAPSFLQMLFSAGNQAEPHRPAAGTEAPSQVPRFCPNAHDVPDPSLGFCPVCGAPLVTNSPNNWRR